MDEKIVRVTEKTLIVGIDIAKRTHWAQFTDHRGIALCKPVRVDNCADGFSVLTTQIEALKSEHQLESALIGFEPSGHYWRTLAWHLMPLDGVDLAGVNPYHVKQMKELDDNTQTKSDKKDALVIARLLRDGRYFNVYLPENEYADLRVLQRHHDHLSDKRKWAINILTAILDEYFPEQETIGFHVSRKSTRIILRTTPFPSDVVALGAAASRQLWIEMGAKRNTALGHKFAHQLYEAAKDSVGITAGLDATRSRLHGLLDMMDLLDCQIEQCENQMMQLLEKLDVADYLLSVPGVGNITASCFIAETGDLNRFSDWKQVRKLAGLNLVEQSSGQHKGKTRISKRGRPNLRCIIYIIGDKGMLVSREMQQFYQYLRHRPVNQLKHNQAVLAVGLKLMRIMFHVVKYREYYDPAKSLGEVRLQQIQSAA